MPTKPGTEYSFDKLDFEVREYQPGLGSRFWSLLSLSGLFYVLSVLCLIGAIVAAVLALQQARGSKAASKTEVEMKQSPGAGKAEEQKHQVLYEEQ